ncbi:synaptonemal complex protein 2 isoform X2 [Nelusetta ayraudi]|uniref:synaptonemal complex protein 2 isoform X2 n=1 Tax=Nelusetta ayraudi TaxID=303726 RepID=UPI003F6F3914
MDPVIVHMVQWFDNCRQLWEACGPRWDVTLLRLSECYFDTLMVVHESCKEGTDQITKLFFYPIARLVVEPGIHILIQKEALRKLNFILGKMPANLKKNMKMATSQEASDIQVKMARHILDCGDYDFQTAMIEAFCRINTSDQRKQLANRWFSSGPVSNAFIKIKDSEFETDCREFLNFVNEMQGGRRRVHSYPCLAACLDRYELLKPVDEDLKEFWVDFNLGSHSISFYFSLPGEEVQESKWETICITENEVQCYTVKEECKRHVLRLNLSEVVVVGEVEGSSLTLYFSTTLNIQQAASSVFGQRKNTGFVGKTSTVKTTVKILSEENSSQVVPESQLSLGHSEKNVLPAQSLPVQISAPAKMRMSESVIVIRNTAGSEPSAAKGSGKPALQMVSACDERGKPHRTKVTMPNCTMTIGTADKNKPQQDRLNLVGAAPGREESPEFDFVPDTQTMAWRNGHHKLSVSEMQVMPTQKISSHPKPDPPLSNSSLQQCQSLSKSASAMISSKQAHSELTAQRLQQFLDRKQQSPLQEEPFSLRKNSNIIVKAKDAPIAHTSKAKQTKENVPVRRRRRSRTPKEEDGCLVSAPKAPASKALQENKPPEVKARANQDLSSKEKRDAELAGNMVKFISSRYENSGKETAPQAWNQSFATRPVFNLGWASTTKNDVSGPQSWRKCQNVAESGFSNQRKSPVSVNTSSGKKVKTTTNTSALPSSGIHDASVPLNSSKKGQAVCKEKRHVNKHLFSDTDTATTDVSWLRETGRGAKSRIIKYSRRTAARPKAVSPHTSYASSNLDTLSKKSEKTSAKPKMNPCVKQRTEPALPRTAGRGPRRAAAVTRKNYKELDTDSSLSELETVPLSKVEKRHEVGQASKKNSPSKQPTKSSIKPESSRIESKQQHSSKGRNEKLCPVVPAVKKKITTSVQSANTCRKLVSNDESNLNKTSKVKGKMVPELSKPNQGKVPPAKEQKSMLRDTWAHGLTSSYLASPFMEKMRSAERSAPALALTCSTLLTPGGSPLSASPKLTRQDVPSPIRPLPSPRSALSCKESFKPTSFLAAEKKHSSSKTRTASSNPSLSSLTPKGQIPVRADRAEMFPVRQPRPSPPRSARRVVPLLTSTVEKPHLLLTSRRPFPEGRTDLSSPRGCSSPSSATQVSLSLSSIRSLGSGSSARDVSALARTNTKSPPSDAAVQVSGPPISGPSRKRRISTSSDSESEKKEQKRSKMRGQRSPVIKPRRLFKALTEVCAGTKVTQVMSSSHTSSGKWGAELDGDADMSECLETPEVAAKESNLCQQFSSEMNKKFVNRCKMVEVYNKQSLKTMQQHVSTLNTELTKYRTQSLEKVLVLLQDEIHKLEHNDTVLKDMEKDLTVHHCLFIRLAVLSLSYYILEKAECDVPHSSGARKQQTPPPEEGPQEQRVPPLGVRGEPVHNTDVCDKKRHEVSPGQAPHSDARGGDPECEEGTARLVLPLTDFSV